MKRTFLLISIIFITFYYSYSQEFVNDSLTSYFSKLSSLPILGIEAANDAILVLGYGNVVKYSDNKFETFWLNSYSKGNISQFKDSNNYDIWKSISSNNKTICLYKDDNSKLTFLVIMDNVVYTYNIIGDKILYATDINLDAKNNIWFIGHYRNNEKPAIFYLIRDSLEVFSMNLPDSLKNYRIDELFTSKLDKYIVFSKLEEDFIMNSFVLKVDSLNNYTYFNFPSHKRNNNGYITYKFYFDYKTIYILNNYSDLLILDSNIKILYINEKKLGECFSFVVIDNSLYYGYTNTNTEINLTRYDLNNSDKKTYSKSYSFNRGVGHMLRFKDFIIGLSGPCYQWNGEIFKFKYR